MSEPSRRDYPIASFLFSEADGRRLFSTVGLATFGLPELQMKKVAGNHCRAARFVMTVVGRRLVREHCAGERTGEGIGERLDGSELTLTPSDVMPLELFRSGSEPEAREDGEARVRLALQSIDSDQPQKGARAANLLTVLPPAGFGGDRDEWLRLTARRLGQDAPRALPISDLNLEMDRASKEARATLAEICARFQAGLDGGRKLVVKVALPTPTEEKEFVWVEVQQWDANGITGTLVVQPFRSPGYRLGQPMRVSEEEVFDRTVTKPTGVEVPSLTDRVAQEFGLDVGGGQAANLGCLLKGILALLKPLAFLFGALLRIATNVATLFARISGSAQKELEQGARQSVEATKKFLAHRSEYVPVRIADLPGADVACFDAIAARMAALGMPAVGDVLDQAFQRANPDKVGAYRIGANADGTIHWRFFTLDLPGNPDEPDSPLKQYQTIVLYTALEDGRSFVTVREEPLTPKIYPNPPNVDVAVCGAGVDDAYLLEIHRRRVTAADAPPRAFPDLASILAWYQKEEQATAEYRESLGVELYRHMFEKSLGESGRETADALLRAIAAHPEWR